MPYDEALADRVRRVLGPRPDIAERKMFGGLAFLRDGKMFCGVAKDELMVRVGPERYEESLAKAHVRPMDFTGRPMNGYVFVAPSGCRTEKAVKPWVELGGAFVATLEQGRGPAKGATKASTRQAPPRAIGISLHTGWGACVVVSGSLAKPEIVANEVIEILGDSERFCFHMAADMERPAAKKWIATVRKKALANAKRALASLVAKDVRVCAIVAKTADAGDLDDVLGSHPRIHTAEGCFYRDILRDACPIPVHVVPPASLDPSKVGKLSGPPWGKDQKLAALAAWKVVKA